MILVYLVPTASANIIFTPIDCPHFLLKVGLRPADHDGTLRIPFGRTYVCQFAGLSAKVFAIISSKGVLDVLITMVPSELLQNVPFGRYKYF